jgi:hypothetical protein
MGYSSARKDVEEDVVKIRCQETTSEDIDDFMCAAVQCREVKSWLVT